jgi:hypothetical protein
MRRAVSGGAASAPYGYGSLLGTHAHAARAAGEHDYTTTLAVATRNTTGLFVSASGSF